MGRQRSRSRSGSGPKAERSSRCQGSRSRSGSKERQDRSSRRRTSTGGREKDSDRSSDRKKGDRRYKDREHSRDWDKQSERGEDFARLKDRSDRGSDRSFSARDRYRHAASRTTDRERALAYRFDSPPRDGGKDAKFSNFSTAPPVGGDGFGTSFNTGTHTSPGNFSSPAAGVVQSPSNAGNNLSTDAAKAARELYVGNLPPGVDVNQLVEFLNAALKALNANSVPGNPVTKAWISSDNHYAFVEFRNIEEATNGMVLNGLNCLGYALRVGRPKTFPTELANFTAETANGTDSSSSDSKVPEPKDNLEARANAVAAAERIASGSTAGAIMPDRLCILDMPDALTEERIRELVTVFGSLRCFQYLKVDGNVCVLEYEDVNHQQQALSAIDGLKVGRMRLKMCKAEDAIATGRLKCLLQGPGAEVLGGELMRAQVPTRVLMLSNIVLPEELKNDKEYEDILEDVKIECSEYGIVMHVEMPRPVREFDPQSPEGSHIGCAFIEYTTIEGAGKARKALSGRKFSGRTVEAHYFSERLFKEKKFEDASCNYDKDHSSIFSPELADHVKDFLEALEEERKATEAAAKNAQLVAASVGAGPVAVIPRQVVPAPLPAPPRIVGTAPPVMPAVVPVTPIIPTMSIAKGPLPPLLPLPASNTVLPTPPPLGATTVPEGMSSTMLEDFDRTAVQDDDAALDIGVDKESIVVDKESKQSSTSPIQLSA